MNDTTKRCQYCPDGSYQDKDYHLFKDLPIPTECKTCDKGTAAVKVLEFEDFEIIPSIFANTYQSLTKQKTNDASFKRLWYVDSSSGKITTVNINHLLIFKNRELIFQMAQG